MFTMQGKWAIDRHITSKTYNLYLLHEVFNIIYRFSIFLSPFWWWFHQYLNHVTWLESCDVKHGGRFGFCSVITFGTFCQNFFQILSSMTVGEGRWLLGTQSTDWLNFGVIVGGIGGWESGQPGTAFVFVIFPHYRPPDPTRQNTLEIVVFTRAPVLHGRSHTQLCTHSCSCLWLCGASHYVHHQPWLNMEMHPPHPPWPGPTPRSHWSHKPRPPG